ncbi:sensor histidine kinase [Bacillus sp. KH172YL63]|uniref:sensor histidine kinase n=1 Tax=Bacillus sp. KH172YL63 TaxID=2709784 RepID=UPI0013E4EE3E|nr:sensor histidine kinase [Bacillus sp. KH172YL63]BCB02943.1 sensor histidine kinase LiaS [Bacillus sp. KH172YL63]
MNKSSNIRNWIFKSFFMMSVMAVLLFFVSLQVYLMLSDRPSISLQLSIYLTLWLAFILLLLSIYFGFRTGYTFKGRIDDISTFITLLRSGKFSARVDRFEHDELGILSDELNQLAVYIQEQVKSLQRLADEKSELADQAHQAAVMEERHRLARDLHDSVSQQLFALNMLSSAAQKSVGKDGGKVELIVKQIADIAGKAQGEMRALLLHLRPIDLKGESLCEALTILIRELKEKTMIEIDATLEGIDDLSKGTETHMFRIIQESLSNILRHSEATKVKIVTEKKGGYVSLYISDNGKGFDLKKNKMTSYGLQTMRERAEEIGGRFQIRSKEREGTYIDLRIPV